MQTDEIRLSRVGSGHYLSGRSPVGALMNPYQVLAIQTPSPRSAAISGRSRRCTGRLLTSIPSAEGFPSNLPQSERSIFRISDASGHWFLLVGESTVPVSRAYKHNNNKLTVKPTESNCETRLARTCALAAAKAPVKKAAPVKVAAPAKTAAPIPNNAANNEIPTIAKRKSLVHV